MEKNNKDISFFLKKSFDPFYEAPIEAWEYFLSLCEVKNYKKNEILKKENEIDTFAYFMIDGAAGSFVWKDNYKVCIDLFFDGHFFADDMSLFTQKPSPIELQVIENTKLLKMHISKINELKKTPLGCLLFNIGDQQGYIEKQKHQIEIMTKTAEERYKELLDKNPKMVGKIHQKHIASYLGITPQSLSRIRKNLLP